MSDTKVDRDYLEAFNQGYEVAKELGLKPDDLNGINAGNNRMQAMKDGMEQYGKDIALEKDIIPPLDLDGMDRSYTDLTPNPKHKDKDIEL
ncbi:hypothetical protein [Winogradskyella sp. SYSU M77433]|uniref:hypothetical protein n=1 Tax=Winogradskyella sp. SYSU M77433 TaxID=3042722 RepID=UPI0024818F94|nr:hypothetical protein [Winogradskyella sp. SYSU M77433]MDH7911341.1 hypothetical protein [Winogradskyella sp. SYSU M77433]